MGSLDPLLGTALILMAHPDDEIIICGALMQRMKKAVVVFATDGAPRDEHFWKSYGSRQAYAAIRQEEARKALALVGADHIFLPDRVAGGVADQELFRNLSAAAAALEEIVVDIRPDCILAPAYEGGHPDHDACCFLSSMVGKGSRIPVWESPLYHRNSEGESAVQTFPSPNGSEIHFTVAGDALARKSQMFHIYESQHLVLDHFHPERETFRPLVDYDFTQPPLPWKLNYEVWEWKMTGQEVSAAFAEYLQREKRSAAP